MRILLSNDDGVLAPGIQALAPRCVICRGDLVSPTATAARIHALTRTARYRIQSYPMRYRCH